MRGSKKIASFPVVVIEFTVHFCDAGKAFTLQVMCPSAPAWEAPKAFGASHAGAIFPAEYFGEACVIVTGSQ